MTLSKDVLYEYVQRGLVLENKHNTLPLTIYNYTNKVQYEDLWDDVLLQCRGLILNDNGGIVARPFKKFFNIEESKHTPTAKFEVFDKVDGSLGILFWFGDKWNISTRGSFHSDQSVRATSMLEDYDLSGLPKSHTHLLEIIYPENRIVVDYGKQQKLIYLSSIEVDSGEEVFCTSHNFECVKKYDFNDYTNIKNLDWDNSEGFVVLFDNGDRCKIKFENYVRLHKIVTGTNSHHVWESMKNGESLDDLLTNVPDEFHKWLRGVMFELTSEFVSVKADAKKKFEDLRIYLDNRALFANYAKQYKYPQLMFGLMDEKDIDQMIWKIIKPKDKEKAFSI